MNKSMKLQGFINFDSNLNSRGEIDMKDLKEIWGNRFNAENSPRRPNLFYRKKPKTDIVFVITMVSLMLCAMGLLAAFK